MHMTLILNIVIYYSKEMKLERRVFIFWTGEQEWMIRLSRLVGCVLELMINFIMQKQKVAE